MNTKNFCTSALALFALAGTASTALGQTIHPEVEPNDNKTAALANGAFVLAAGDGVSGTSQGSNSTSGAIDSRDYFLVKTTQAAPGIYRHRLVLGVDAGTAHSTVNIRGVTQTNGVINFASDTAAQSAATVGSTRELAWYGFGRQEQLYFYVQGTTSTTGTYTATLHTDTVPVTADLGRFQTGTIQFSTVMQAPVATTLWVLDSNFNIIPDYSNNLEPSPGTSTGSRLTRTFTPGAYYLAIGRSNVATSTPAAYDDRLRNAIAMDFPDVMLSANSNTTGNVTFSVSDEYGPVQFPTNINSRFQVQFYSFEVGQVTEVGACCLPEGTCTLATAASCSSQGGTYNGNGSTCAATVCDQPGACCVEVFGCLVLSAGQCATAGGTYNGNGSACTGAPCSPAVVTNIDVFNGHDTENLIPHGTGTSTPCIGIFSNQAQACPISGIFWLVTGWGSSCSLNAPAGSNQIGGTSAGTRITFDRPIRRFGAQFAMAQGYPSMFADFFDEQGLPIAPRLTLPNYFPDCTWRWNGWEFGVPVKSIEFRSSGSAAGPWATLGGQWQVDWWQSPPTGACCLPNGTCAQELVAACVSQGGIYQGDNTTCGTNCKPFLFTGAPTGARNTTATTTSSTVFMDLTAVSDDFEVYRIDYTSTLAPGTPTSVEVWTYPGSYVGNIASNAGWTLHETIQTTAAGITMPAQLELTAPIHIAMGQTVGVYLVGPVAPAEIRWKTGSTASDGNLSLFSNQTRTEPFAGTAHTNRSFAGRIFYRSGGPACYANCDSSTVNPILNVDDFTCFINEYASAQSLPYEQQVAHYSNCDGSTIAPVLNVDDFTCFINQYAQGCP
jgi:hypothetical protein